MRAAVTKTLRRLNSWRKSWTIHWGALLVLAGYFQDNISQVMPIIKRFIPDDYVGGFVMFVGMVVIVLRFKTNSSVNDK